ncbi:MAG: homoserine O-succinyltransferase [Lachnospiraceae bacterium]|nr:homoserine O-succinyltransferase [Lachnospiraceae bacterium]
MPIKIQNDLPVKEILENENIFVMDERRAQSQDIRPLKICILNLMPLKEDTELQLLRCLSNTPLQVDVEFMKTGTHVSQNTSANHLNRFYSTFEELKENTYDGLIITGAPVELMEFEEVDYWDELTQIMDWSKENVTSTFHICWGAQAGLYYHFGLPKVQLGHKLSGIFKHTVMNRKYPLVRGFDDVFVAPHSRYTDVPSAMIHEVKDLVVLAESEIAGVLLCMTPDGKQIFVTGHLEYDRLTLKNEYERDLAKGIDPSVPENYFPNNDPTQKPLLVWRAHSNNLYSNWLNYYVYQNTPYELSKIRKSKSK